METLLKIIHILVSLVLVLVVLLQSGRGGGMGAAFGGASGQIFGGRGAGNFLTRVTTGAAILFFTTSLTLSMMSSRHRSVLMHGLKPAGTEGEADPGAAEPASEKAGGAHGEAVVPAAQDDKAAPAARNPDAPAPTPPGVPTGSAPAKH